MQPKVPAADAQAGHVFPPHQRYTVGPLRGRLQAARVLVYFGQRDDLSREVRNVADGARLP